MGVYSIAANNVVDFDSETIKESRFTPDMVGTFAMIAESEEVYNNIMKAVGLAELACLESTGAEIVYEAADSETFIEKVKKFFSNMLDAITSLFKKFIDTLRDKIINDAKFVEKFEKELADVDASKLEYDGYVFSHLEDVGLIKHLNEGILSALKVEFGTDVTYDNISGGLNANNSKILEDGHDLEEVHKKMRGVLAATAGDAKTFDKEIFKYFRSGEDTKTAIKNVNVKDLFGAIKDSRKTESDVKAVYNAISGVIKKEISDLNKLKRSAKPASKEEDAKKDYNTYMSLISKVTGYTRIRLNILNMVNGGYLSAINANRVQSKAICVELLKTVKKEDKAEAKHESVGFEHSFENYMSKVVLK